MRVRRHIEWVRTEGLQKLIEEDRLDPILRGRLAMSKWHWRRQHGVQRGNARPVFLVGLQRSGTNMITRGIEAAPECAVYNENNGAAFHRFRLRPLPVILDLVTKSAHELVIMKPLCDSHRLDELLAIGTLQPARAVWIYRSFEGRARSAVAKFGDHSTRVLRAIAAGQGANLWQAQRLSDESLELVRRLDLHHIDPHSSAAALWCIRNAILFEQAYDRCPDVLVVSYDRFILQPELEMRRLCGFIGLADRPELTQHIDERALRTAKRLDLDPIVRDACERLQARLDTVAVHQAP